MFKWNFRKLERQPHWQLNITAEKALDALPSLKQSLQFLEHPQLTLDENQWRNVIRQILKDLQVNQSLSDNALDLDPENIKIELSEHEQDHVYLFKCEIQDKNANPVYQLIFEIENDPYIKVPNIKYDRKIIYHKKRKRLILDETLNYDSLKGGTSSIKLHGVEFIAYSENIKHELPGLYNRSQLSLWQDAEGFKKIIGDSEHLEQQVKKEKESLLKLEKKLLTEQLEAEEKWKKKFSKTELQKLTKKSRSQLKASFLIDAQKDLVKQKSLKEKIQEKLFLTKQLENKTQETSKTNEKTTKVINDILGDCCDKLSPTVFYRLLHKILIKIKEQLKYNQKKGVNELTLQQVKELENIRIKFFLVPLQVKLIDASPKIEVIQSVNQITAPQQKSTKNEIIKVEDANDPQIIELYSDSDESTELLLNVNQTPTMKRELTINNIDEEEKTLTNYQQHTCSNNQQSTELYLESDESSDKRISSDDPSNNQSKESDSPSEEENIENPFESPWQYSLKAAKNKKTVSFTPDDAQRELLRKIYKLYLSQVNTAKENKENKEIKEESMQELRLAKDSHAPEGVKNILSEKETFASYLLDVELEATVWAGRDAEDDDVKKLQKDTGKKLLQKLNEYRYGLATDAFAKRHAQPAKFKNYYFSSFDIPANKVSEFADKYQTMISGKGNTIQQIAEMRHSLTKIIEDLKPGYQEEGKSIGWFRRAWRRRHVKQMLAAVNKFDKYYEASQATILHDMVRAEHPQYKDKIIGASEKLLEVQANVNVEKEIFSSIFNSDKKPTKKQIINQISKQFETVINKASEEVQLAIN